MVMLSKRASLSGLVAALFTAMCGAGCGSSSSAPAGASGSGGASCADQRSAFVQALTTSTTCSTDDECRSYIARCLTAESGNCSGIFYIATAALSLVTDKKAAYEACSGSDCNAGVSPCALGPEKASCINGTCE